MKKLFTVFLSVFMWLAASPAFSEIVLTPKNTVTLRGPVDTSSVTDVSHKLLTSKEKDLYLFIDSPGGSIMAGMQLVYVLQNLPKGTNVTCISNFAASMAFIITQACPKRVALPHSILMQHVASYGVQGNEPNNYSMAGFIRRMVKKMNAMQAKRLGMKASDFYKKTRDDWWLYGDEALEWKAVDKIEENVTCSAALTSSTEVLEVQSFFFTVKLTFSRCPLIRGAIATKAKQISGEKGSREARQELQDLLAWWSPAQAMNILQEKGKKLKEVVMVRLK